MKLSDIEKDGSLNLINNSKRKSDIIKIKDYDNNVYDIPYMSMITSITPQGFTDLVYNFLPDRFNAKAISDYFYYEFDLGDVLGLKDYCLFIRKEKMSNKSRGI